MGERCRSRYLDHWNGLNKGMYLIWIGCVACTAQGCGTDGVMLLGFMTDSHPIIPHQTTTTDPSG